MNKQTEIESKLTTIAEMIEAPEDNWWKMGFEVLELCELYAGAVDVEVDWSHGIYVQSTLSIAFPRFVPLLTQEFSFLL